MNDFAEFSAPLTLVANNPCSTSVESDQARSLSGELMDFLSGKAIWNSRGTFVAEIQTESLRRRIKDFLSATRDRQVRAVPSPSSRRWAPSFYL